MHHHKSRVQVCCTLSQWLLKIVAVGVLCMPTIGCGQGGEMWLQASYVTVAPTIMTYFQPIFRQANLASHCIHLFTK